MLASVLNSPAAVAASVAVVRAFIRLREILSTHKDMARKLEDLERKFEGHDADIQTIFDAIRALTAPPDHPRPKIGFRP